MIIIFISLQFYCFSEGCKYISITPKERKDHCLKEHNFPSNFRFDRSVKIAPKTTKMEVEDEEAAGKPHSSKYKPFHFGCGTSKTFKHLSKPRPDPMESMIVDLKESLPEL